MSTPGSVDLQKQLALIRLVAMALISGMVMLTIVMAVVGLADGQKPVENPRLTLVAAGALAITIVFVYSYFPRAIERAAILRLRQTGQLVPSPTAGPMPIDTQLVALYTTTRFAVLAMLEGPGLIGAVCLLIEHHPLALLIPAVSAFVMYLQIPNRDDWDLWLLKVQQQIGQAPGSTS